MSHIDKIHQSDREVLPDEMNPRHALSLTPTDLLAAVVRGELDLNLIAKLELANRGQDDHGEWVGFEKADMTLGDYETLAGQIRRFEEAHGGRS